MHQWHPQLHRSRNLALPTTCVGAVDAADGDAQLADGRSPLPFMTADRSSAMAHRRGIQEIHRVLGAAPSLTGKDRRLARPVRSGSDAVVAAVGARGFRNCPQLGVVGRPLTRSAIHCMPRSPSTK